MNNIRKLRIENNMKQSELAEYLSVAQGTLSYWENDKYEIDNESLKKLADYFNVTTDYLLGRTDDPTPLDAKKSATDDISLDDIEFALFGEVRELTDEDKQELLRDARRMRELSELRKKQREQK